MSFAITIDGKCEVAESFTGRKRARQQIRHIDSPGSLFH
jgi:hypothetical protein